MSTISPPSATSRLPVASAAAIVNGTMQPIPKDSSANPPSAAPDLASQPISRLLTTDPTATSRKNQENPSLMQATPPANCSQDRIAVGGAIAWP